jgi:hypothetical protein
MLFSNHKIKVFIVITIPSFVKYGQQLLSLIILKFRRNTILSSSGYVEVCAVAGHCGSERSR